MLCTPAAQVPPADVRPDNLAAREAEVVVGVPLGQRAADVRAGRAGCGPEIHGAHEHGAVHRVGVDEEGGVRGVEPVAAGGGPVGVVHDVAVRLGGGDVAGRRGGGEAGVLGQRGLGLGHQLVGGGLLGRGRRSARHRRHHHAVRHDRRPLDVGAHGRGRLRRPGGARRWSRSRRAVGHAGHAGHGRRARARCGPRTRARARASSSRASPPRRSAPRWSWSPGGTWRRPPSWRRARGRRPCRR